MEPMGSISIHYPFLWIAFRSEESLPSEKFKIHKKKVSFQLLICVVSILQYPF